MLKKAAEYQSEFRLVLLITVSVFIIEAFVGVVLSFLPSYSIWFHELIDAVLLVILLSPVLFFLVFRPMVQHNEKRRQLEGKLQKERNFLEDQVNERTAELSAANDRLKQEIIEHKIAEDLLQERTVDLDDRIREIQCLYRIAKFMEDPDRSWEELVQMTVDLIPFAWLDPGNLGIQVVLDGREFKTKNFKKTGPKYVDYITADGKQIGTITVCCLAGKTSSQDSIFLNQRHQLIANVAEQIGIMVLQRRTQAALRDSIRTYRTVAENLHEGIWFIDQNEHTTYVNPRMADILGYTVDEMTGQRLFDFMDERGVELCEHNLERRRQGIKEQHDFELLRKDGERIYTSMETTPVTDAAGNYIGALASVADITERKNIELELQQRTRDLGERVKELNCLYGISNLINKPGISLPEILQGIVDLIPHSWQYSAIACAAITLEDQEYKSDNFTERKWVQSCKIRVRGKIVGSLKVFYLENKPEIDEGPFLKEERELIEAIAVNLGRSIEKIRMEEELQKAKIYLEKRVDERTSEIALANKTLKGEIEERKLAEQRLQQNRTMLQAVFDGIADPLVLVDHNLVVKIINQAAAEYYQIGDNQATVGMVFWEATQKSDIFKNCKLPAAVLNNQVLSFERKGFMAPDRLERVFIYPVKEKKGGGRRCHCSRYRYHRGAADRKTAHSK